ncbi:MAG: hypothetical protein U0893_19795 [Chloroflexota bacterium]
MASNGFVKRGHPGRSGGVTQVLFVVPIGAPGAARMAALHGHAFGSPNLLDGMNRGALRMTPIAAS